VLILDRENPTAVLVDRLKRLGASKHDSKDLAIWGGFQAEECPEPDSAAVLDWVAKTEPKPLIVVDSLVAFHSGSENDSSETRKFMNQFRSLADKGATVILIHHSGKAETAKDYRGSSDIKAAVDVALKVESDGATGNLTRVTLSQFKARVKVTDKADFEINGATFQKLTSIGAGARVYDQLTKLLESNPRIKTSEFEELAHAQGLGKSRARKFLADGIESGRIRVELGDKNAKHLSFNTDKDGGLWAA
ncbi:MAG: AAA family ATPase, partial [Bryobacteraceae bacterium]